MICSEYSTYNHDLDERDLIGQLRNMNLAFVLDEPTSKLHDVK